MTPWDSERDVENSLNVNNRESRAFNEWILSLRANWQRIYFFTALGAIIFAYGVIAGIYDIFPHQILRQAKFAAYDWRLNYRQYLGIRPEKFIHPVRQNGNGVTSYIHGKAYEGLTLIASMWDNYDGVKLISMDGAILHHWRVSLNEIWSRSERPNPQNVSDWDVDIHGALLYPNGDVVFNLENEGLVKIDRCSKVIWKVPFITHHSIYQDSGGNLWVPGRKLLAHDKYPLLYASVYNEYILKVAPTGEILEQISLLDIFFQSSQESLLFANGLVEMTKTGNDILHVNSIVILEKDLSKNFPLFKAGDIMVSMRNLNLLVVIDGSTHKIKWTMTGPYIRQHDPHFLSDGRISVYDNRSDDADGKILGGSRILIIDPVTRQAETKYQGDSQNKFYTNLRGKHQYQPNGNLLITEPEAGRVFEVTPSREIVWSYINRYDDDEVYTVTEGTRYPLNYAKFTQGESRCD